MNKSSYAILSNQKEALAEALKEKLFFSGGGPFDRRFVIVESAANKSYLTEFFARDPQLSVSCGVEFYTLAQALAEMGKGVPTSLELALHIQEKIKAHLQEPVLAPVSSYLGGDEEKLCALSQELAHLFSHYCMLAPSVLQAWKQEKGWQQFLWEPSLEPHLLSLDCPVYIFCLSSLPPAALHFFLRTGAHFFVLSPSQFFWGDLNSSVAKDDAFLEGQNPVLARFTKAGHEVMNALLDADYEIEERYVSDEKSTMLASMRMHLLEEKEDILIEDESIQLHSATSLWHEVEVLHANLLKILETHAEENPPIYPSDILVLAPNIADYLPYIQAIFTLKVTIFDLPARLKSPAIQGLDLLVALAEENFSQDATFSLLAFPPLMQKFSFSHEDLDLFKGWAEKAELFRDWDKAVMRLLEEIPRLDSIFGALDSYDQLENFILIVRALKQDLVPLVRQEKQKPLVWLDFIKRLLEKYFLFEENGNLSLLPELYKSASLLNEPIPFSSLFSLLDAYIFQKKGASVRDQEMEAVQCRDLKKGASLPARVVYLLGMEEGAFPRGDLRHSLYAQKMPLPNKADIDRFLFLELLLCAQDYWIFSYKRVSPEDGKLVKESSLIHEFFTYLNKQVHYKPEKTTASLEPFIPHFYRKAALLGPEKKDLTVTLKDLRRLARNPVKFYLEKAGFFLKNKTENKEFLLPAYERAKLLSSAFKTPMQELLKKVELPQGLFQEVATQALQEEEKEIKEFLLAEHVTEICEIEWKEGCKTPQEWKPGKWIYPSLQCILEDGSRVSVVGKLAGVTEKGLIFRGKDTFEDRMKIWPEYLLFLQLQKEQAILLTKEQKRCEYPISDVDARLKAYLEYYRLALLQPSPLVPQWAEALLTKNPEGLAQVLSKQEFPDPYLEWVISRDGPPSAEAIVENWEKTLRGAFYAL